MAELDVKSLWSCSYGIYVVSSRVGDELSGQIANTVIQVTAEPPRISVTLHKENLTHEIISRSGVLGVSVLEEETPFKFIGRFGFNTGRTFDKFKGVDWEEGATGSPLVLEHAVSVFDAEVFGSLDVGTHTVFAADTVSGRVVSDAKPLTYAVYRARKGRAPKHAPTYRGESARPDEGGKAEEGESMKKYECQVCGYIYDPSQGDPDGGIEPGTAFEDIPDDWVCPVCGASKDQFEPVE